MNRRRTMKTAAAIINKLAADGGVGASVTGVLTLGEDGNSVYCPNPSLSSVASFHVGAVYGPPAMPSKIYSNTLESLLGEVLAGNNAMVVLVGEGEARRRMTEALLEECAKELFDSLQEGATVRLSWCQVMTDKAEGLADLLKAQANMRGAIADPTLLLREGPHGRGILVPGLWEVQVKSTADIKKVLERVFQQLGPKNPWFGPHHSLLMLDIEEEQSQASIGKLSFLTLANLLRPKVAPHAAPQEMAWLQPFRKILQDLENKHPSPSFHRSRLTLLLRDALCGRIASTAIGVLAVGIQHAPTAYITLQLLERLHWVAGSNTDVTDNRQKGSPTGMRGSPSSQGTGIRSQDVSPITSPLRGSPGRGAGASRPTKGARYQQENFVNDSPSAAQVQLDTTFQDILPQGSPEMRQNKPRNSPWSGGSRSSGQSLRRASPLSEASPDGKGFASPSPSFAYSSQDEFGPGGTPYARGGPPVGPVPPPPPPPDLSSQEIQNQVAAAMKEALDASAKEVAGLVQRVQDLESQLADAISQRDELADKLEREGGTLRSRDKASLQKARQDIKDYEVYKDVMEGTMKNLRDEMKNIKNERDEAFAKAEKMDKSLRKNRSTNFKHTKELIDLRQTAENAEIQKNKAFDEVKELQKMIYDLRGENRSLQLAVQRLEIENEDLQTTLHDFHQVMENFQKNATYEESDRPRSRQTDLLGSQRQNYSGQIYDEDDGIGPLDNVYQQNQTKASSGGMTKKDFTSDLVNGLKKSRQEKYANDSNLLDRADGTLKMAQVFMKQMKR